jgi:diguanylate cyclase (GGDEF)-like protein
MSKTLSEKIEEIRDHFIESLPTRLESINTLTKQVIDKAWDQETAQTLMFEIHNLRGFSATNSFTLLNDIAAKTEDHIVEMREDNKNISEKDKQTLKTLIANLGDCINDICAQSKTHKKNSNTSDSSIGTKSPLILIVDDDKNFCNTLALQLEHLGYRTRSITDLNQLVQSVHTYNPQAIFMDMIFNGKENAGTNMIKSIRDDEDLSIPIVYMSAKDDMNTRLEAVRSDGVAFLSKSFSLGELKNMIDIIIPIQKNRSYKVLIIDDDKISSSFCSAILEHAGIHVSCLYTHENIFDSIVNFDPDVILLDMYMPHVDGFEMASVIRQHQNFSAIPIVIMSSETDINKQFKMRSVGADDFILKPFKPHHLIDTIMNRIKRSRQTKRLIYTDGLTGLLLFNKIKDQVSNLLESCVRYNLDFSIALIDLDYFKQVNDVYGHLTGDQILRNFSEFLLSRVRKSDIVTRSGGEEFTIIFPYTNAENALRTLNALRESFAQRLQHADGKEFKVTFSAGIANVNRFQDLTSLLAAADQALYRAKEKGRNNIEIAT